MTMTKEDQEFHDRLTTEGGILWYLPSYQKNMWDSKAQFLFALLQPFNRHGEPIDYEADGDYALAKYDASKVAQKWCSRKAFVREVNCFKRHAFDNEPIDVEALLDSLARL